METSDDETEEELVYLKFDSMFDKEIFNSEVNFKLIGLDTDEPVIQLGAQVFTGKWEMATGTCTFFEEDPDHHTDDPIFNEPCKTNVKYVCKTRKVLRMYRTVLTKRTEEGTSDAAHENAASIDAGDSLIKGEEENAETGPEDPAEMVSELTIEDIEQISLEPSEVNPAIIDEIMEA